MVTEIRKYMDLIKENIIDSYNVIGFANQYYTLWEVVIENDYIIYKYLKNLSFNFDEAKLKAGTDRFEETLRGKSKTFTKLRYNNGEIQEFENTEILQFVSSIMPFGKYKGKKIIDIVNDDPGYLAWVVMNTQNEKLNKVVRTLKPVKDILNSNKEYSKKQNDSQSIVNNVINDFNEYFNTNLNKWKETKDSYILRSETIKTKTILKTPFINDKGEKKVLLNITNDKQILVLFKRDTRIKHNFVAQINNFDISQFATPQYLNNGEISYYYNLVIPEEIKNREYELEGYFILPITHGSIEGKNRTNQIKFICTKVLLL